MQATRPNQGVHPMPLDRNKAIIWARYLIDSTDWLIFATRVTELGRADGAKDLKGGKNPISYKKILAFEIVKQLNSHEAAHKAQEDFEREVQNKEEPLDVQNIVIEHSGTSLAQIAINKGLVSSNSEWKRLVVQGGIKVNNEQLKIANEVLSNEIVLQRGRKIIKIKPI